MHRYRGFHRKEPGEAAATIGSDPSTPTTGASEPYVEPIIHKRADLTKTGEYVNLHYVFFGRDRDLYASTRFAMDFTKGIGRFSWSPVMTLSIDRIGFSAESSLIPQSSYSLFGRDAGLTSAQFRNAILMGGAMAHYRSKGGWGWAGGLSLGLGRQLREITIDHQTTNGSAHSTKLSIRFGVEKQIRDFILGMDLMGDGSTYELKDSRIDSSMGYVMLYVAYIFAGPESPKTLIAGM
jgi:hypothetical protein